MRPRPDRGYLLSILAYEPDTGIFRWKVARRAGWQGHVAGSLNNKGRRQINIDGRMLLASHIAWLFVTGEWPTMQIDHKNLNKADDAWGNLREATPSQNVANQNLRRGAKHSTGFKYIRHEGRSYEVRMGSGGRAYHRSFETLEEALAERSRVAAELYGEFARLDDAA